MVTLEYKKGGGGKNEKRTPTKWGKGDGKIRGKVEKRNVLLNYCTHGEYLIP